MNSFLYSLRETTKSFFFLPKDMPAHAPYIRDPIDIKRIMTLVVISLMPCTFFAILQSGMLAYLYDSIHVDLFSKYLEASTSYLSLIKFQKDHFFLFFFEGLKLFIPQLLIIYLVGGVIEIFFASLHRKTVTEGFFVTGILFALIIPPTLPYWMTIVGVISGLILGKELFGGTGMNIFNPALVCRCIIYFSFPSYMTGHIWIGNNTFTTLTNAAHYNTSMQTNAYDAISVATPLNIAEKSSALTKLQIDAAALSFTNNVSLKKDLEKKLAKYNKKLTIDNLSTQDLSQFLVKELGITEDQIPHAVQFAKLCYGEGPYSNQNLFFGNMGGSFGEVSKFGVLLGLILLLITRLISIRILLSTIISALLFAKILAWTANPLTSSAYFFLPAYKQLLIGSLFFGAVFMATEPVTAPTTKKAQILYGVIIGFMTILIRMLNPAFPEGVMLAILFANAFSPLLDRVFLSFKRTVFAGKVTKNKEICI